jgi:crotonobetainyl-CoA:carnitine CoA-transferase CaiB-like acyl-CoA transferase
LLGQHTHEILSELGYDEARQTELVQSGVCIATKIQEEEGDG